jgi:hypothetical protein
MTYRFAIPALFFLLFSGQYRALAQQRFSAGPRVGLNLAKFNGEGTPSSFRPGLAAGAFVMYSSLNHFGISVDVLYSQRGASFNYTDPTTPNLSYKTNSRINYLEIPVALRYFLNRGGDFRPNLFAGPSLGIRLNANTSLLSTNGVAAPANNTDISSQVRPIDLGLLAGFQLNFPGFFGERQRFLVDARYTYGLTKTLAGLSTSNYSNSTITVTLGYGFGVGREFRTRYKTTPARK